MIRKVFGASSEKLDPSQIDLFLLEPENAPGKTSASSALEEADPRLPVALPHRERDRWPQDLPVVEAVIDPEEVKAQLPSNGAASVRKLASSSIMSRPGSYAADWCGANMSHAKSGLTPFR